MVVWVAGGFCGRRCLGRACDCLCDLNLYLFAVLPALAKLPTLAAGYLGVRLSGDSPGDSDLGARSGGLQLWPFVDTFSSSHQCLMLAFNCARYAASALPLSCRLK